MKNFLKILKIDEYSLTPYHRQLSDAILKGIDSKLISQNDTLPSINDLSIAFDISRNIVTKAYGNLKRSGVVSSVPGKGYFVSSVDLNRPVKVLLLFNKLSTHKKAVYDAFAGELDNKASIDFYIYNSNFGFFKKLLLEKQDSYDKIVLIPHFVDKADGASDIINLIPEEKLILLGKLIDGIENDFGAVYEDFEKDIFNSLTSLYGHIKHYKSCVLVFPNNSYFPTDILIGFSNFCKQFGCDYKIISDLKGEENLKNHLYITLAEDGLIDLIDLVINNNLIVGKDVGIISYNETPLKKFILNGIATISTDFEFMGKTAAHLVLDNSTAHIKVPFKTTVRNSIVNR